MYRALPVILGLNEEILYPLGVQDLCLDQPNITGEISFGSVGLLPYNSEATGALYLASRKTIRPGADANETSSTLGIDASRSSSSYADSVALTPASLNFNYVIRT